MFDPRPYPPQSLTLDEVRTLRAEQALLAQAHADRVAALREAGRWREAAEANREYRQCARRCRLLGERMRADHVVPPAAAQAA